MKLGVNIDHIATLRQARGEGFPSPVEAAIEAQRGGAEGIVCHLREDRRHIQDADLPLLRKAVRRLDLEMAATEEMVRIAVKLKPEMVTLVPERREELTTEGGLQVTPKLAPKIARLQKAGILVSLFVEPEENQIRKSASVGADFVEIHTGAYARVAAQNDRSKFFKEIVRIEHAVNLAWKMGLRVNAGHGLDYINARRIVQIESVEELNIGFSIIARALIVGIKQAVKEMIEVMK